MTDSFSKRKLKLIKLATISRSPLLYKNDYSRVYSGVFNEGTHTKDLPSVFKTQRDTMGLMSDKTLTQVFS